MATTPIYNWSIPDNTDLVKNGALAIRTLGDAIDTTMATMTPKTIVDAKGDLIAATAADTPARLAVGANGETLVADSSTSTGLRYGANFAAGKNKIINGDFGIWQRGTSFTSNGYGADRFAGQVSGTSASYTYSRQTFTPGTAPVAGYEGSFFARLTATGTDATTRLEIYQGIEDVRTFAAQTVTVSFWVKGDSARTGQITPYQIFGAGGSSNVLLSANTFSVTTSWTRVTSTFNVPSISGKTIGTSSQLLFYIGYAGGNATSTPIFDIWGVQIEAGSVATAFQTASGSIGGELALCQRYYFRSVATASYSPLMSLGNASSSTAVLTPFPLPVQMRTKPSSVDYANLGASVLGVSTTAVTLVTLAADSTQNIAITDCTSSGLTQYRPMTITANNNSSAFIGFSAEL